MPKQRQRTLLHVMIERVGFRKSYKVALFVACWMIAQEYSETPVVTMDDYAEWWAMSRAKAFRDQQAFRGCFPEFATPSDLWVTLPAPPPVVRDEDRMAALVCAAAA